jgi:hypothetical protein
MLIEWQLAGAYFHVWLDLFLGYNLE